MVCFLFLLRFPFHNYFCANKLLGSREPRYSDGRRAIGGISADEVSII